jgi:hypothetical protein
MGLYIYVCDQCDKDVMNYSLSSEFERFHTKVLQDQQLSRFDNFPSPFLVKKRMGGKQFRLIAKKWQPHHNSEHIVVVALRVLKRGSREYGNFSLDAESFGQNHLDNLVSEETLNSYLEEQIKIPAPDPFPVLNESESNYLYNVFSGSGNSESSDILCFESPEWVQAILDRKFNEKRKDVLDLIIEIVSHKHNGPYIEGSRVKICFQFFPDQKRLFLIYPTLSDQSSQSTDSSECRAIEERYKERGFLGQADVDAIQIQKNSLRSYDSILLCDEDAWFSIQKNAEANLALSPEESNLLDQIRTPENQTRDLGRFPLFINGRAGSGKSTLLQFLFADYLKVHLDSLQMGLKSPPPLYLSYSSDLLKRAEETVLNIERFHESSLLNQYSDQDIQQRSQLIRNLKSFFPLHQFLQDLIPASIRESKFRVENRVSFLRFKRIWDVRFSAHSDIGVGIEKELAWHVIRTYIKGLSAEEFIDPSDYVELPRGQRSVTDEAFKGVYKAVWEGWYSRYCQENHLWDTQDLVRYLLTEGEDLVEAKYPAIFCDEAQDFTRIELDLLFRLCVFSRRQIPPSDLSRIPFAFAGDPFQTLNPTGFRWENTSASFHEKVVCSIDPSRRSKLDFNYQELNFNYRSSSEIVKLCNFVQALRSVLFGLHSLKPQTSWQSHESGRLPTFFYENNKQTLAPMEKSQDLIIIVPCEEGEEGDFVANDPLLSEWIECDDAGVPANVLSPMRAKGLEFNRVVIYKFGHHADKSLLDPLTTGKSHTEKPDQAIPLEYFMNKLYVAVSRARKSLFIVDSEEGKNRLWETILDSDLSYRILKTASDDGIWLDSAIPLDTGSLTNWDDQEDRENLLDLARKFENEGERKEDTSLLRKAFMYYRKEGRQTDADKCQGRALYLEENYLEAAKFFEAAGRPGDAIDAYWAAEQYTRIINIENEFPGFANDLKVQISQTLTSNQPHKFAYLAALLKEVITEFDPELFGELGIDQQKSWNIALKKVLVLLLNFRGNRNIIVKEWIRITELIETLNGRGFTFETVLLAEFDFQSKRFEAAARRWDEIGKTTGRNYQIARAKSTNFPDNVIWYSRLGWEKDITREFKHNDAKEELSEANVLLISRAFENHKQTSRSLRLLFDHGLMNSLGEFRNRHPKNKNLVRAITKAMIEIALKKGNWEQAIELTSANPANLIKAIADIKSPMHERWNESVLTEFLITNLTKTNLPRGIDVYVGGMAMEKGGTYKSCLRFYKHWQEKHKRSVVQRRLDSQKGLKEKSIEFFCIIRSAKCKWKRADYEQSMVETMTSAEERKRRLARVESYRSDAQSQFNSLGLIRYRTIDDIPDLPEIPEKKEPKKNSAVKVKSISEKIQKKPSLPSSPQNIGNYQLSFYPNVVTVMDRKKSIGVTIHINEKEPFKLEAFPSIIEVEHKVDESGNTLTIPDWGIEVDGSRKSQGSVKIKVGGKELKIPVD